jgi:Holliday junction resolvase RusA-like endonuclease
MRTFTILGQVHCGKNNIGITKKGHRYPNKAFAEWAKDAIDQVKIQSAAYPRNTLTIPLKIDIDYYPADRRIRDIPAIFDAVFHALEKAGVVENDAQFKQVGHYLEHEVDRESPRVVVRIKPKGGING